ncbi:hypothetical protein BGZ59_003542 [Podila verticillata]|nr:hypothetical protein BGZ59_003542 [Podila verticillata]KAI9237636.1 MAG: WD40-repeat-containing domain protein [Podila humilis]KFH71923.1 hypothetical protein MVEG_02217 [Podila verticillata NRRL 6337]
MSQEQRDVIDLEDIGDLEEEVVEYHQERELDYIYDEDDDMLDGDGDAVDHDDIEEDEEDEDYEDMDEDEEVDDDDEDEDEEDAEEGEDEEDEEDDGQLFAALFGGDPSRLRQVLRLMTNLSGNGSFPSRRRAQSPTPEPDYQKGREILNSGDFGAVESAHLPTAVTMKNVSRKLWMRQLNPRVVNTTSIGENFLPSDPGKVIEFSDHPIYSGGYSADGSIFASCDQDYKLRIYKTAGNRLIREKVVQGIPGRWTITDHALSLDNDWIIYSSITPYVHLTRTAADAPDAHHQLDFSPDDDEYRVALWSVQFSGNGREIVAGGHNRIYVYDIESRTVLHSVDAHEDDVNSVCFSEPTSSQVVFSGSDDGTVKVWDRRSMRSSRSGIPSGVLVGHTEGITHVTSKGDNRYLASNGKDQKMLLWDLRMMHSNRDYRKMPRNRRTGFDYRDSDYYGSKSTKLQGDCSVMTFQGHKVLRTLIRCHFSPVQSTGQRYLYTGSADGLAAIYRLDGTLVKKLDVNAAFQKHSQRPVSYIARDVSWHPHCPSIISSCRTDSDYTPYADVRGGLVQHAFRMGVESDDSESDVEPALRPVRPRRRRRAAFE